MKVTERGRGIIPNDEVFMKMLSNYAIADFINYRRNIPESDGVRRETKILELDKFMYQVTTNIYKSSIITTVVKRANGDLSFFERLFGLVNKKHLILIKKAYLYHAYSNRRVKFIKEIKDHPFPLKYYDLA